MTPLDQILTHDWTIPLALILLAAVVALICWDIHRYHQDRLNTHREDHRIPPAERALVGDDYRDCVRPYFYGDRFAARYRRDRAVTVTCLTPEKVRARRLPPLALDRSKE